MIEKIDIKDASIAEEIRKNMAVSTENNKGLMDAGGFLQMRAIGNGEYNTTINAGVYSAASGLAELGGIPGVLIVFKGAVYSFHLFVTSSCLLKCKTLRSNGETLKDWVDI